MKKATITFITSAALAFALPLYAADKPVLSDSEQQAGVTQQGFIGKSDPQQKAGMTQQGTKYDAEQKAGMTQNARMTQQGMKSDSEQNAGLTQQGIKSDPEQQAGVTQQGFIGKSDPQQKAGMTQQGTKYDAEQKAGMTQNARMTQQGMKSDSEQNAGLTQHRNGQMQSGQMITADKLQGMEVVTQEGEEIGEIQKITIDKQSGEVQFVTFSKGGILGMGAEEIAAPLSAFEIGDDQARLTVTQSKLENVPQQTAEATDSDYLRDLETHYGVAPAWEKGNMGNTSQTQKIDQGPTKQRKVDTQN